MSKFIDESAGGLIIDGEVVPIDNNDESDRDDDQEDD